MARVKIKLTEIGSLKDWAKSIADLVKIWPDADADLRGRIGVALVKISKQKYLSGQILNYQGRNSGNKWRDSKGHHTVYYWLAGKGSRARSSIGSYPAHLHPRKARQFINSLKRDVPSVYNAQGSRWVDKLTQGFEDKFKS